MSVDAANVNIIHRNNAVNNEVILRFLKLDYVSLEVTLFDAKCCKKHYRQRSPA